MIYQFHNVLIEPDLRRVDEALARADWRDGRITAGPQSARAKQNQQVAAKCPHGRTAQKIVLDALEEHNRFISAALPARVFPPLFNRYSAGDAFGDHIDNALRQVPGTPFRVRTDISATLFLSDPDEYEGGELIFNIGDALQRVKLPRGSIALYPGSTVHRVTPVTRGERRACFFWVQSLVRDASRRALLFDMDWAIQELSSSNPDSEPLIALTGCYHNLLREWSET